MFERFTDIAKEVVGVAQERAKEFGHSFIGTEHLLLALSEVKEGVAGQALNSLKITPDVVKEKLLKILSKNESNKVVAPNFTERAKRSLELSLKEAIDMQNNSTLQNNIATEHLLLGILREGEGVACKIIAEIGVSPREIKDRLYEIINISFPNAMANMGVKDRKTASEILDQFGRNLTKDAIDGKLDPVIGRKTEVERILQILSRRTKNNPILIGEPGVGKTAVVEGFAQAIVKGDVPQTLKNKQVYVLDLGAMVAGTQFRGMFEDRIKKVLEEVEMRGDVILFIDEIHTLVGAGNAEGALDAASVLKPKLARGELQTIGATTIEEYRKHFEKDAALERRFQPIMVNEPTVPDAIEILKGLRGRYEAHHKVTITDDAIESAVKLSARYLNDRFLPDKAIDLLDEAGARLHINHMTEPENLRTLSEKINRTKIEIESAANSENFELAARLKETLQGFVDEHKKQEKIWQNEEKISDIKVDSEIIAQILEMSTGIPVYKLTEEETKRLLKMEEGLHQRVIGQDVAIKALSKSIRRTRAGLKDPKRPSGSFIFAGPTGVGKTELAKALAEFLFGDESALIQVDMSEYGEKHTTSKLFGAPPGFVGYDDGGQLTEKIRRKPFSVVLFDEIEKAHPDIFNTLLQVLEDGHLTDSTGRLVDFKNTVIIMTTNLGSKDINRGISVGFDDGTNDVKNYEHLKAKVHEDLKKDFRPEFLNRLDDIIVFAQLSEDEILQIVDLLISSLAKRLKDKNIELTLTADAKKLLAKKGYDPVLGARPLRRTITKEIEDDLSEKILFGDIKEGDHITIDISKDKNDPKFTFSIV